MEGRIKMKINGPNDNINLDKTYSEKQVKKNEQSTKAERLQQGEKKTSSAGDIVNISAEATQIRQFKSMIEDIPDIRESRVHAIKEAVGNGNYRIDSDQTAQAILRETILDHLL